MKADKKSFSIYDQKNEKYLKTSAFKSYNAAELMNRIDLLPKAACLSFTFAINLCKIII